MTGDWDKFRDLLNAQYQWPTPYRFKFVVPMTSLPRLESALEGKKLDFKPSKTGKYMSVTYTGQMSSADEIIEVYQRLQNIPGIITL